MARSITYQETFNCSAKQLFNLLITPSAIRQWWGVSQAIIMPKTGGVYTLSWGENDDAPEYITSATIEVFKPGAQLKIVEYRYYAKEGSLPFEGDFYANFTIIPTEDAHSTDLKVVQGGFPEDAIADDFYHSCIQGWKDTFSGIRKYLRG